MAVSDKSVAVSLTADISSDSAVSDEWQELTKSDYAKVIFSDLLYNVTSGTVECKFQITDNVHEDPNDYVGLFRIGHEDLSQCLVSKMLSQTTCEDDGKLQRCVFTSDELPCLNDGFYQFLYVTRDQEVCGASMPFLINMSLVQLKESPADSSASENMDGGFLLVSNEIEGKGKESNEHKETSTQSVLSEQKKEEIAAWVSQNPDYYLLIEQIKEHTFTIDALQQSKDLAMKEVAQLYEILNTQNGELIQLKNMLAAYEEKIKMSQCLQDEKNAAITEMRKSLTAYEEKIKLHECLQNEKDDKLSQMKKEYLLQEEKLKTSLAFQDQQQIEITVLKKKLEEMKERQKAKECYQVTTEKGGHSMETVLQKTQDLVCIISAAIKNLDFTDEDEVEKFFELKTQLLIILSKMARATDLANICDRNGLHKIIHSVIEKDMKGNSCTVPMTCAFEDKDPVLAIATNAGPSKLKIPDFPTSSTAKIPPLVNSRDKEAANEDASKKSAQRISVNNAFESEVLERQIIELPRLDVINEATVKTLLVDKPLDIEDVTVINKLTEKIIKRSFNLYEIIEVDDSSSDSGSDASEISECSTSLKKDLQSVGRIMQALSCLSNQTILEQLIVTENEEDKNLIHRNDWHELLQKCALRYQIEILFEHIEKQKEGIKKVSEKICDLLTKCMVLNDEVSDSKAVREKLQAVIDKKDMLIERLKGEIELKNNVLLHFCSQKEVLEYRMELAERTIEDFHARIVEASNLYKQQYKEIERLSKKLRKYKSGKDKQMKSSEGESSQSLCESSKTTSSFEVVKKDSVQNINDSDTGEHMFEKASLISNEKNNDSKSSSMGHAAIESVADILNGKAEEPIFDVCTATHSMKHKHPNNSVQGTETQTLSNKELKTPTENCSGHLSTFDDLLPSIYESKNENLAAQTTARNTEIVEVKSNHASLFSDFASYEHFQEVIKGIFANIKNPATSRNSLECSISCYVCKGMFFVGPDGPVDLINHLESEHWMKTCPFCGQLFEEAVPPKYFHIHVEQHFETE
ncbi:Tax1-binding protein 1 like protein [Argiope bruennichi]|uniref:Tax1-binding protein 1 like protein n=1 Tax=Argiope bruennichi TaxID=94029 RepID=A0A8T0E3B1_ARGBR|nr:Tax1-binding protein 1 like protein [Argiope bruennichi]